MHCCRTVNGIKNKNIKNSLDDNMEYWQKVHQIPQNDFGWQGRDTSRPRQMVDIQYGITIMGGREVSRPYQVWFFAEANGFYPFSNATDLVRGRRW